jgi:uncharacterized glyoxalase superfamily protein PhnB
MSTMTEFVEVAVAPERAFTAFTDEYDQWWGNGPIDGHETWRLVERRIEPGVGGRIVEDLGDDVLVLGTITHWEPGERLAWETSAGVTIDVEFAAVAGGTRVSVTASVPDDIDGTADIAVVRMMPQWFPRHVARVGSGEDRPDLGSLGLVLRSRTPASTARWLADTFQLEPTGDLPDREGSPSQTWIEFRLGAAFIVLWGDDEADRAGRDSPFVFVSDLDAHLGHARAAGATITAPITEHGFRSYEVEDCEGRPWVFAQAGPRLG